MTTGEDRRPGYEVWRRERGHVERTDGLTVDPSTPPRFVHPDVQTAHEGNRDAEKRMLDALYNWRYLVYQDDNEAAKAAYNLFRTQCQAYHFAARQLVNATRPPVAQRPRSKDE